MLGGADNPNGELPSYITGADKISGDVGIRQERPERGIMRRGRRGVFLLTHGSSIKSAASQQSSPKSPQPRGQQLRSKP